jgi:hypothetical protein
VLRWGGFLDTVAEGITGVYFDSPESASISEALDRFENSSFDPDKVKLHVEQFTEERYSAALHAAVDELAARPS